MGWVAYTVQRKENRICCYLDNFPLVGDLIENKLKSGVCMCLMIERENEARF